MIKSIFNNKKLTAYDVISTGVYFILTCIVSNISLLFNEIETQKTIIQAYAFLTPLFLYGTCYKSLRNFKMFIVWLCFSFYHLFLYKSFITNNDFLFFRGHAADGLQLTIYFVILFEVLRIGHLKIMGYELVSLGGYGARKDIWDNRKIVFPDIICFFIYMPLWIIAVTAF